MDQLISAAIFGGIVALVDLGLGSTIDIRDKIVKFFDMDPNTGSSLPGAVQFGVAMVVAMFGLSYVPQLAQYIPGGSLPVLLGAGAIWYITLGNQIYWYSHDKTGPVFAGILDDASSVIAAIYAAQYI